MNPSFLVTYALRISNIFLKLTLTTKNKICLCFGVLWLQFTLTNFFLELEPENVEGRRVVSSERPNVATERNLNAPSEENTLAIAEFDNIDQRMTVDRRVSRSISGICHV